MEFKIPDNLTPEEMSDFLVEQHRIAFDKSKHAVQHNPYYLPKIIQGAIISATVARDSFRRKWKSTVNKNKAEWLEDDIKFFNTVLQILKSKL